MFFCNITFCFIDYICFMQKLALLIRYIHYLYRSTTSYGVHPPFLFDLVTRVFKNKSINANCLKIEALKDQLVRDKRTITVTDLGAGSVSGKGKERRIGIVARNSSKPKKYGRLLFQVWLIISNRNTFLNLELHWDLVRPIWLWKFFKRLLLLKVALILANFGSKKFS